MQKNNTPLEQTFDVRSYALRRVNPFLGVLQVIETDGGRAVSANGVVWDIEVRARRRSGWGSMKHDDELAYYRYGLWSQQDGLVSRPLAPHLESDPLTRQCQALIEAIQQRLDQLPFPLADSRELWLLDQYEHQPLVLLAAIRPGAPAPSPEPRQWSCSIGAEGVPSQRRFPEADAIQAQVKQAAGFNLNRQWITRHPDGSGTIEDTEQLLDADSLPTYLISEHWSEPTQAKRVADYIRWIAPSLLTLQRLSRDERARLETCLNNQAISLEHHVHLYPEILDEKQLNAARVQCKIQKANGSGGAHT